MSELLGQALNGVISPIFETTWNVLKEQYDSGLKDVDLKQKKIQLQQATELAAQAYHQKYLDRHCNVKVLPGLMKEAMPLDTIYTAVKFLGDSDLKYFSTLDDLEEMYRQSGKRRFRIGSDERKDGLEAANQEQYLMVLGGPGVGKSTFLRKLGLEVLKGNLAYDLIPVFIELKSFKSENQTIAQAITKELEIAGFPGPEILMESLLLEGKMLVLLDGLDEVPVNQENNVIEQIRDFCDRYSQNRFVSSCRIAAYKGGFNRFVDVTMAEFDDAQIEHFIKRWFSSALDIQADTATRFWKLLGQPESEAAKELAQTPLLLTFLCLSYDRSQSLPKVRSTLYGDALNILLKEWAAEKRLERDPIYQGFHADLEKELLAEIAYESFSENQLFFSKAEIVERISIFLEDTLNAPKYLDGEAVLNAIEKQQGILVERSMDVYSFSHLTLQEYLVAQYISSYWMIDELVYSHCHDEHWREIFLLVSGLTGRQSHKLFLEMSNHLSQYLQTSQLQTLFQWLTVRGGNTSSVSECLAKRAFFLQAILNVMCAIWADDVLDGNIIRGGAAEARSRVKVISSQFANQFVKIRRIATMIGDENVFGDESNFMKAGRQALAILQNIESGDTKGVSLGMDSNFMNVMEMADSISHITAINISKIKAIDLEFRSLVNDLSSLKAYVPKSNATSDEWLAFGEQLLKKYVDTFSINDVSNQLLSIEISIVSVGFLQKYLYSVQLLLNCKASAIFVSRQQWQAIEACLLMIPNA